MSTTRLIKQLLPSLLLAGLILLISCGKEEVPIPLTEEKLVEVLIDMHMAESMIEKLPVADRDTVGNVYYRMIYREHGVTQQDFDESMNVLREDPERLDAIYVQIMERLNVLEASERGDENME
ncbi:DUF4296 domain-containing protein [Flavilitoribacter nigricans]|uniref:DUF4296 domain-containing protein n=1 Tax=Flavilitoribacter nigricans (strain ATCC 23147 / DSM 23189 / NBRC 102662 / NCIMB 1420 / SS-2) TaxID=1122177 RepID=A0A2D0NJ83_FLAN2|nr:DUF4296 domain-containing protein [Flavilitoribacter nigricans]PHN08552.1 hypothetical protein CRP01_01165 [Flavilitoribacter nigricans DSM 23189 = NBRC 102662]